MSDDLPRPLDRLLDWVVFAPLGLALTVRDELPRMAAEGRRRFNAQAGAARMMGELAVSQGRRQASAVAERLRSQGNGRGTGEASGPGASATEGGPGRDVSVTEVAPGVPWPTEGEPDGGHGPDGRPDGSDLPITGYDSLSASQVVQRLAGLSPEELAVVRSYEAGGRARKTILTRIQQLAK